MAKKKRLKSTDEFGFDTELDLPDFDYQSKPPKNDRHPAVSAAKDFTKGTVTGIWDATRSESFIKKTIKGALPSGYGSAMELADEATASIRSLYNSGANEIKPALNEMKRATAKLLPSASKILPAKMQQRIKAWTETANSGSTGISEEAMRHASTQAMLGDVFAYQAQTAAQERAEDKAEADIQKNIDHNRANTQITQLSAMRIALQRLADYQDKVTVNFQRKTLELQYRQYFVAMDALSEAKRQNAQTTQLLQSIQKNTGLPDLLKIKAREDWPIILRNKFMGNVGGMVLSQRSQFMRNLTGHLQRQMKSSLSGIVGGAQMAMGMGDMVGGMADMGGPSGAEMGGNMVGGMVADGLAPRFGKWIGKHVKNSKYAGDVNRIGNLLQFYAGNAPQHAMEFAHSDKWDDAPVVGGMLRWLKDQAIASNGVQTGFHVDNLRNLQDPAPFNGLARKSLTEIIPGYLARIYRELQIMRTGDSSVELTHYDHAKNTFGKKSEVTARALHSVVRPGDAAFVQERAHGLVDELEKGSKRKLTAEQRKVLIRRMMSDNLNNRVGSAKRYSDIWEYQGADAEHGDALSGLFRDYFSDDTDNKKQMAFQARFAHLGSGMADSRAHMQDMLNSGQGQILVKAGLIRPNGTLDLQKLQDYYLGESFAPQGKVASGRRRRRGRSGHPFGNFARPNPSASGVAAAATPAPQPAAPAAAAASPHANASSAELTQMAQDNVMKKHGPVYEKDVGRWLRLVEGEFHRLNTGAVGEDLHGSAAHDVNHFLGNKWGRSIDGGPNQAQGRGDFAGVIAAIKQSSSKTISEKIHATLVAIQKKITSGVAVSGHAPAGDGVPPPDAKSGKARKAWLDYNLGDIFGGVTGKVRSGVAGAWDWMKKPSPLMQRARGMIGNGLGALGTGGKKALEFAKGFDDIYVGKNPEPVLLAWKLKAGHYRDKATGQVIKSYKDIKGDVVDAWDPEKVILKADEIGDAFTKSKAGLRSLKALGSVWRGAKGLLDAATGGITSLVPRIIRTGARAIRAGMNIMDAPQDIYVKGNPDPVLLAIMMRSGAYVSQRTGHKITRPGLIDGPVMDVSDPGKPVVALSKEMIGKGLVDVNGKPIRSPLMKLLSAATVPIGMAWKALKGGLNIAKGAISKPFELIGNWVSKWIGKDGLVFAGSKTMTERLTEIRDLLKSRLPERKQRLKGDETGDGFVTNSWEEMQHKGEIGGTEPKAAAAAKKGGGIAALLAKLKGGGTDKTKGSGNLLTRGMDAAEGAVGSFLGTKVGKAGRAAWGGLKRFGGRLLGRGASAVGETGIEAAAGEAAGAGATLAEGAGAVAGIGEAAAVGGGVLAAGAGGLAALIASPVVLGAAAVGLVGYGLYRSVKGIKNFFAGKPGPLATVRMAQYGFLPDDNDSLDVLVDLEKTLLPAVTYGKDGAQINAQKVKLADVLKGFDIDQSSKTEVQNWLTWFQGRFKPVFLTHMTALHGVNSGVALTDVDKKLTKEEKQKYLKAASWPNGPYNNRTSPFHNSLLLLHSAKTLKATGADVRQFVAEAEAIIAKEPDTAKKTGQTGSDVAKKAAAAGAAGAAVGAAVGAAADGKPGGKGAAKPGEKSSGFWAMLGIGTANAAEPKTSAQNVLGKKPTATMPIDPSLKKEPDRLDLLASIRYRTYGLTSLDADKVAALKALEVETLKALKIEKGAPSHVAFLSDSATILAKMGSKFGVIGVNNTLGYQWQAWFNLRFLPTYMNYVGASNTLTGHNDAVSMLLTPETAVQLGRIVAGTKSPNGKSAWEITASPWNHYDLSTDATSVKPALDALAAKGKKKVLADPAGPAKPKDSATPSKTDQPSFLSKAGKVISDAAGAVGNAVKKAATWAGNEVKTGVNYVQNTQTYKAASKAVKQGVQAVQKTQAYKTAAKAVKTGVAAAKSAGKWVEKTYSASAQAVKNALLKAMAAAGIKTPQEQAMLMAQMDHESGGFKSLTENLHYSAANLVRVFGKKHFPSLQAAQAAVQSGPEAIADAAYGGRMGNTDPDDGYKYRGRGVVQLTGKDNYAHFGKLIGVDLVNHPDLAAEPETAAKLAVAYWQQRVKGAGKSGDVRAATLAINGGLNGLSSREQLYQQYLQQAQAGKLAPSGTPAAAGGKDGAAGAGGAAAGTDAKAGAGGGGAGASATTAAAAGASGSGGASTGPAGSGASPALPDAVAQSSQAANQKAQSEYDAGSASDKAAIQNVVGHPMAPSVGASSPPTSAAAGSAATTAATPAAPSVASVTPAASPAVQDSPFGFGASSAQPLVTSARSVTAVQQAQHQEKMGAMGDVSDILNKGLKINSDQLDTLKAILTAVQTMASTAQQGNAANAPPASQPASNPRGARQMMPASPVSMRKQA
ncbi:glycoside hydrolase family 19 protein [Paraburkholderia sp. BCC1886]|uniref:glycoside hydrolase family 19 protein n=1 Tax=Paraburkholderia sp. BCC1886 TaxID=2562670 RepID=UPI0011842969|nr:glycoside hydrolase family 19 protein [Paraburkholderia sp. BCC1886]